jgi:hypothetical protein
MVLLEGLIESVAVGGSNMKKKIVFWSIGIRVLSLFMISSATVIYGALSTNITSIKKYDD